MTATTIATDGRISALQISKVGGGHTATNLDGQVSKVVGAHGGGAAPALPPIF